MDELDLLKKNWNKNSNFEQVSETEIYKMLHRNSASIVKWILIISILEFLILNGLGFFITSKEIDNFHKLHPYLSLIEYGNFVIVFGFIIVFYRNYRSIHVLDSSRKLIQDIIKTRRIVKYYIYWNIFISTFIGAFGFIDGFFNGLKEQSEAVSISTTGFIIIFIFSMLFVVGFFVLFYKILYGILLNKLEKNYKELKKMDI